MFPLIALFFFSSQAPDPSSLKVAAEKLRIMTAVGEKDFLMASEEQLRLVSQFRQGLVEWIEPQLPPNSATNRDCIRLTSDLSARLRRAGVLSQTIKLSRPREYSEALLLEVGIGIPFGVDAAAYLYQYRSSQWHRVFTSERKQDRVGTNLNMIAFSPSGADGSHLLVTLATPIVNVGCVHGFDYQVVRVVRTLEQAVPIIQGSQLSDTCYGPPKATIERDGFRIDFMALTRIANRRPGVLKYKIEGNAARRVPPVALKPEDFVDEWLARTWHEAAAWTAPASEKTLQAAHDSFDRMNTVVVDPASTRCSDATTWQVTAEIGNDSSIRYFLIREPAGHDYQMIDVSPNPHPGCSQK